MLRLQETSFIGAEEQDDFDFKPLTGPDALDTDSDSVNGEPTFTVDEAMNRIGHGPFQTRVILFTGAIFGSEAMEMTLLSFIVPKLKDVWNLSGLQAGLILSSVSLGSLIGSTIFSILSDRKGRRILMIWSTFGCALLGSLSAMSPNLYVLLLIRFVLGVCMGGGKAANTYASEMSSSDHRGHMNLSLVVLWSAGAITSVLLAWISFTLLNWRWYLLLNALPFWFVWLGSFFLPESPRFLSYQNRLDEAMQVLKMIAKENDAELPEGRLVNDVGGSDDKTKEAGKIADIFRTDAFGWASYYLFGIFNLLVAIYYGINIVSEEYFDRNTNSLGVYLPMVITTSAELPGLLMGFWYLDRLGRKQIMIVCMIIFTVSVLVSSIPVVREFVYFGIVCMFSARLCITLAFAVIHVYFNEYYPTSIRTTAMGFAASSSRITAMINFFIVAVSPVDVSLIMFGVFSLLCALLCYALPFDTTGIEMLDTIEDAKLKNNLEKRKITQ